MVEIVIFFCRRSQFSRDRQDGGQVPGGWNCGRLAQAEWRSRALPWPFFERAREITGKRPVRKSQLRRDEMEGCKDERREKMKARRKPPWRNVGISPFQHLHAKSRDPEALPENQGRKVLSHVAPAPVATPFRPADPIPWSVGQKGTRHRLRSVFFHFSIQSALSRSI